MTRGQYAVIWWMVGGWTFTGIGLTTLLLSPHPQYSIVPVVIGIAYLAVAFLGERIEFYTKETK